MVTFFLYNFFFAQKYVLEFIHSIHFLKRDDITNYINVKYYFKLKGWVITFPPDQSERPPWLSTNEIEALSRRLIKADFQPARAQAGYPGRT